MKKREEILSIIIRYLYPFNNRMLGHLFFYSIFTFLTIQPVYLLLSIFFNPSLVSNIIIINNLPIEIIGA